MIAELERRIRRLAVLPLAVPLLLAAGLGVGRVTTKVLSTPEDAPVRIRETTTVVPRTQLETLSRAMEKLRTSGEWTAEYVVLYREHVAPIELALRRLGVPDTPAREIAWPLLEHATRQDLDPATVLSVLLVESSGRPSATSSVGARGLMQVMPFWAGHWEQCGRDLYDIEANLCYGTRILADNLRRFGGDERRALLAYNGCVRGTNTPNCHTYPDKVARIRRQVQAEWRRMRGDEIQLATTLP